MIALPRLTCTVIGGLLIGFPGLLLAEDRCVLPDEAEFSGYVSRLAEAIGKKTEYVYGQGDDGTPERAFVRGAIGVRADDLFMTVQFDRSGEVTDFDVQRRSDGPVDDVVVHLMDQCLDPFQEDLGPLASAIEEQVKFQIAQEDDRKAKAGL